jgi:hypothetical protein
VHPVTTKHATRTKLAPRIKVGATNAMLPDLFEGLGIVNHFPFVIRYSESLPGSLSDWCVAAVALIVPTDVAGDSKRVTQSAAQAAPHVYATASA